MTMKTECILNTRMRRAMATTRLSSEAITGARARTETRVIRVLLVECHQDGMSGLRLSLYCE